MSDHHPDADPITIQAIGCLQRIDGGAMSLGDAAQGIRRFHHVNCHRQVDLHGRVFF